MAIIAPDSIDGRGFKGGDRLQGFELGQILADARATLSAGVGLQAGRMVVWAPVFLMIGMWSYFNLASEPDWIAVSGLGAISLLLIWLGRSASISLIAALMIAGFAMAKMREEIVYTPLLRASVSESDISGFVADADNRNDTRRILTIELDSATSIPADEMPRRVRISTFNAPEALIGDYLKFKVRLTPLPMPSEPGGFDYGRDLFFQSIGAMGRNLTPPEYEARPVPWKYLERRWFHQLRSVMGARITAVIPGAIGGFANSIITGERSGIPKEMNTSLQISGLAHIISISGLHMSLVAGGVFWVVRAFLALFPFLALNYPIKKWAACVALVVGLIYMLLADSGSATERSYIMIAVMFFAILVDRPALSMRNLAISALIVLVVTPEECLGASFQMSFLAVMGLVAFFEYWNSRPKYHDDDSPLLWRAVTGFGKLLGLSLMTTIVAGGLSSIAAAYHFGRMSPYSMVANAVALPISDLVVMPAAMVGVLMMPLGLDYWPLKLVEWGLAATMWISDSIATWPWANTLMPHPSLFGISVMVAGALVLCLIIGRWRWVGVGLMVVGLLLGQIGARPVLLIDERAGDVAIKDSAGHLVLADGRAAKFSTAKWLQNNGEVTTPEDAAARPGWTCAEGMCFGELEHFSVGYLRKQAEAGFECPPVDIVIAEFPLRGACGEAKLRIDRFDVWRHGAYAVFVSGDQIRVETAKGEQGARPWAYEVRAKPK